ncbi:tetratricopeptide repeat protein [Clostridium sp. C8-1-8]|uniref:tetratricopeptide repeat protein n=1 Tax=Clostridium sp. C8-1-8 TaxID=2698831 RepID=UPI001371200C|nr:tetratricopeptide repeat protein [Clostridium sp. C8-1-8]
MDCFEVLGIEKTENINEIRRAYSSLLTKYSPEQDPEGFKKLRAAYEEACSIAKEAESEVKQELSPVDEFMEEFKACYKDFEKRLNSEYWTELLEKDICYNIDTASEISNKVLTFLMDNYNFPNQVWKLFDSYFSWTSKKDNLYKDFPKNFIDFVIYKIDKGSTFRYDYLKDCIPGQEDEFISRYNKVSNALDDYDLYTACKNIASAKEICPNHPDLSILEARYYMQNGRLNEAKELLSQVIAKDEKDIEGYFYRAEISNRVGELKEAYDDYTKVLEIKSDDVGALYALGKCCINLNKYEEAVKHLEKVDEIYQYRNDINIILTSAYNFYIEDILTKLKEDNLNQVLRYRLAEAYFKTSKTEESYDILKDLRQENCFTEDMYCLLCQVLIKLNNEELAYTTVCEGVDIYRDNYELNFLKADMLDRFGKYEEALDQYDRAISIKNDSCAAYNNKAYVFNILRNYNEALKCADKAIELDPHMAHAYKNKAEALLGLELYEDCFEACNLALNKYQYLLEAYIIKIKAFTAVSLYDEALDTYNKASDLGFRDSKLYHCKARVLMKLRRYEEAADYCDYALELDENNDEYYYLKGLCYYYIDKYEEAINAFDKAIEINVNNGGSYYYKVQCLLSGSREEEALNLLNTVLELQDIQFKDSFYELKGNIMERRNDYNQALDLYKKAITSDPNYAPYYYAAGHIFNELENYEEALRYFYKSIELDPDQRNCYVNISYSLYCLGKYEACIENCNKALEIDPDYVVAHQNKGWSYYKLQRIAEAEKECSLALKLDGNNLDILLLKLRLLNYKGLYQEALLVCDRMLEIDNHNTSAMEAKQELMKKISGESNQKKGLFKSLFNK